MPEEETMPRQFGPSNLNKTAVEEDAEDIGSKAMKRQDSKMWAKTAKLTHHTLHLVS